MADSIGPDECFEHFVDVIESSKDQFKVISREHITQAYTGIMLYYVGMQMAQLTRTLNVMEDDDGSGETEGAEGEG